MLTRHSRSFGFKILGLIVSLAILSQACVGKFLSTMLSDENANFKIIEATPVANTKIIVSFSKTLNYDKGALNLANYSIPGLTLTSVTKGQETNQVYLFLDPNDTTRMQKQTYTLSVQNIQNLYLDDLLPGSENRSKTFTGTRWLRATCLDDSGAFTCPVSGTTSTTAYNVTVRGDYAKGSAYRWRLYNVTTGSDHFAQSAVTGINSTFNIPAGLPTADYRLDILIQDSLGAWQPASDETHYFFSVDSTPPTNIGLLNTPSSPTNLAITNFSVVYRDDVNFTAPHYSATAPVADQIPAYYKFRVRYNAGAWGSWSTSTNVNQPVNYQPPAFPAGEGTYDIQVVASDSVGNWQCDTSYTTYPTDATAGACVGGLSINAFFAAKTFQVVTFTLDRAKPTAQFNDSTKPVATTSSTSFAIEVQTTAVDATVVSKYQYRIVGSGFSGLWSTDKNPGPAGDLISGAGLVAGTYVVDIIGKDAAGNYQDISSATSYTFVVDLTAPTAVLASQGSCTGTPGSTTNGLPVSPTRYNCYNIKVNNVNFYKYAFVNPGAACPTALASYTPAGAGTPAATPIAANNVAMTDGNQYSICVIGSNDDILYQGTSASAVTRYTFTYDTTPPVSAVVTWLSPATSLSGKNTVLTDVNVVIGNGGAEAVIAYKGTVVNGACPAIGAMNALTEQSIYTPLQATGLATGTTRICTIGRDVAGNYETTVRSTTYTIFAPATPSDGVAGLDNAFANTFNFTWSGIPADTTEIRIQVCRDSACTNPLATMTNGIQLCSSAVTCAATTSYTLNGACAGQSCIKPVNGADYYARLRVTDSIGTISSFGTISSGKKIVGGITGVIRDTFNNPVNGATVNLYQSDCSTLVGPGGAITTTASGVFTFTNAAYAVPILTASSGYCVKASSGAAQGQKTQINVDAGVNTDIGSLYIVNTTGRGCIIGSLVEGSSGSQMLLSNATFTLKDFTGATISGAPNLDPDGKQFAFPASCVTSWGAAPYTSPTYYYSGDSNCSLATGNCLNSGIYSLDVSVPNYYSITESAIGVTSNATIHTGYLPMVGTFASGSKQIKVIATWGTGVKDLDLHVVGPSSNGFDCQPYNEAAIQNANGALSKFHVYFQQKYCAETGTFAPVGSTQLAVDDTYEYGPEIINFYQGFVDGTYKFSIFNNDTVIANWNTSKARVYIYAGNYFTGGGGLIKTITNTASSANSTWKPFKLVVSGTTLTIDDNAGSTYGFVSLTSAQVNGVSDGLTAGGAVSGVSPADPNTDPGLYLNGTTAAGGAGPLDW